MSVFDAIVRATADKFGLGTPTGPLVREVLRFITGGPGGISGFLDRFRSAGLSALVSSWVSKEDNQPLTVQQLEKAVGPGGLDGIARTVGLSSSVIAPAAAFLIPRLIDALTPDGTVPTSLPPEASAFLAGTHGTPEFREPVREKRRGGVAPWLWGLLGLIVLGVLGYWFFGRQPEQVATTAPQTTPLPAPVQPVPSGPLPAPMQPAPSVPPRLALTTTDGKVHYDGVVADEQTRTGILGALQRVFGTDNVSGQLAVDAKVAPAGWLANLETALQNLKIPGVEALFEGNRIDIGGLIPPADTERLKQTMQSIFGQDFTVASFTDRATAMFGEAKTKTMAALDQLKPGYTGADLVRAMNLAIINFETGSAHLSADSREILQKAAAAMKAAPVGTRVEVGGHTDSTGDPAANMALSQQRADAVRVTLVEFDVDPAMLTAKGYGDSKPVASNATPDGRMQNRRIEFVVVQ
jgi:OmpA-OmpF porin, OOP family